MQRLRWYTLAAVVVAAGGQVWANEAENPDGIVEKYLEATRTQKEAMRGVQMEVSLEARLPRLEKHGRLRALRTISKLGMITYKALGFSGDSMIKNQVIARYLDGESQTRDIGITRANYKFKYKGQVQRDGRKVYVLQVTPRKKVVGLFRGELWLDAETSMPVREAGQFVKSPSMFLKKIEFVRDYQMQDGVAVPKHVESTANVRVLGRAELSIDYSNISRQDFAEDAALATPNR
jgi:outer membrane lipoprotein-sorting protein